MMGTTSKLNAQVIIKNLQNMQSHAREASPAHPWEREGGWNWRGTQPQRRPAAAASIRTVPACKAGDHTRADPRVYRPLGWRMW
jgi:hypothetical protein